MRTFLWFIVMTAGLILFGCDSSEQPKTQTTPAAKQAENTKVVVPAVDEAQAVADKAQEKVELTGKMAEGKIEEPAGAASANVEEAVKGGDGAIPKVEEQAVSTVAAKKNAAEKPVTTTQKTAIPQEITLEASYGNVTFPHGMHADSSACSVCHGDGVPEDFDITKEVAHKLCKGCHKDEGAGPTGCKGCHKK
jgi:hypothetical protein